MYVELVKSSYFGICKSYLESFPSLKKTGISQSIHFTIQSNIFPQMHFISCNRDFCAKIDKLQVTAPASQAGRTTWLKMKKLL